MHPDTIVIPKWYIPSLYGDVRLEAATNEQGGQVTLLFAQNLSPTEEAAMEVLRKHAIKRPFPWAKDEDFRPVAEKTYRETEIKVCLNASIQSVQAILSRAMKPGRPVLSAVRFSDGKIEEIKVALIERSKEEEPIDEPEGTPLGMGPRAPQATSLAVVPKETVSLVEHEDKPKKKSLVKRAVEAAVSLAPPDIGCPSPDFGRAEIRARRVLDAFLTDAQREDLRKTGRFVSTGQDTGRRYLLSLRDGPQGLYDVCHRSVYDLEASDPHTGLRGGPCCVHDWSVPSAEEILAIHVMLQLPGREHYMRTLPEIQ